MAEVKKQSKTMYYLPGIVVICLGMVMLGTKTPDETIQFGADFYTESYQAIAAVAHVIKTGIGLLLMALGIISVGKGAAEAKRSDLVLEQLGAIHEALLANKAAESDGEPSNAGTPSADPAEDAAAASSESAPTPATPVPPEMERAPAE